jgi:ComF family protein
MQLLDLIYVPHCAACDVRVPPGQPLCRLCAATLVEMEPASTTEAPMESVTAPWRYGGELGRALRRLKFGRRPHLARELAPLIAPFLAAVVETGDIDVIVPVPLHVRRLAQRGFNPAQALAAAAVKAAKLAAPLDTRALRRARNTAPQTGLDAAGRAANLRGAFAIAPRHAARIAGKRVLLVDDVVTTCATLGAAAHALRTAGAAAVLGFAVARTED